MQMYRTDLWTQKGKEKVGPIEKAALTFIHYMCKTDSQQEASVQHREPAWCSAMSQRGGIGGCSGREAQEGGDDSLHCTAEINKHYKPIIPIKNGRQGNIQNDITE